MTLQNISSGQFWMYSVVTAIIDTIFLLILIWRTTSSHFRELRWTLVGTAAVAWSLFAACLVFAFWETYYQYFFPIWFRWGGIFLFVPLVFGGLALAFHWLALHLPGNPMITFCLLGGMESVVEHLWGIYGFKILEIPFLQRASPASILAFSFPEYIFYWCIILSIATLIHSGWRGLTKRRRMRIRTA